MTKRRIKFFSTINFYFARHFMLWFLVVTTGLLFVIFLFEMLELLRRSMTRLDIGGRVLLQIALLKLPYYFQMFYPFIVMIASQITLWRLNQTQEIIAVRSLGFAVRHIVSSFLMTVFALSIVNIVIFNPVAAITQQRAELQNALIFKHQGPNQLHITDSGLWLRERHAEQAYIIHIGSYNLSQNYFADIDFFQTTQDGALMQRFIAQKAALGDGYWYLSDVVSWNIKKGEEKYDVINIPTHFSIKKILESNAKPETINFWNLSAFIENLKKSGLSDLRYNLHWHVQLSKMGQAFALIFLAAAFCLHPTRYKKASTLIFFGLMTGFIIHFMTDVVHALTLGGKIPIIVGAWSPVFITFLLSMGFIMHTEQEQ